MSEVVFNFPDLDREWTVRAFKYPTLAEARIVWSDIEKASRGKKEEFSIWATTTPEGDLNLVVVCGEVDRLPQIEAPRYDITPQEAEPFVMRRLRVALEASEAQPGDTHFEQRARYGESRPVVINEEGGVDPWQKS